MSRIIATGAIKGAYKEVAEAERMFSETVEAAGATAAVEFPNTGYYLPIIYALYKADRTTTVIVVNLTGFTVNLLLNIWLLPRVGLVGAILLTYYVPSFPLETVAEVLSWIVGVITVISLVDYAQAIRKLTRKAQISGLE